MTLWGGPEAEAETRERSLFVSLGLGQTIAGYGLSPETRTLGGSQMTVTSVWPLACY